MKSAKRSLPSNLQSQARLTPIPRSVFLGTAMHDLGKTLVIAGLALAAIGTVLWFGKGIRLPGDIYMERGNFSFGFPVVTCIVVSIVLTILLNIFRR
jgi:uncharacterized membrane protein YidH (DUF202 family)